MPGELYTELYVSWGARLPDDDRARYRIGVLFRDERFRYLRAEVAHAIEARLGIKVPWGFEHPKLEAFVQSCSLRDLLNTITLIYRELERHDAEWWRQSIGNIFAEQHLAYEIDEHGTVHPAIDQEFQQNRVSAVAALGSSPRYANAQTAFERVSTELTTNPPNYKEAWRAAFSSAEGLFKLMFPRASRLTADQVDQWLRPAVERVYGDDQTALRASIRQIRALSEWVEASHNYRHEPRSEEPAQPPGDLAVLAISLAASFIRWLVGIDAELQAQSDQSR